MLGSLLGAACALLVSLILVAPANAVVDGKFALRACIVNFRTSDADIEALPGLLEQIAQSSVTLS